MKQKLSHQKKALIMAIKTLEFYADPSNYHAISIVYDSPAGNFIKDFDFVPYYNRKMPGKMARKALYKIQKF